MSEEKEDISICKKMLLQELNECIHHEKIEDVIFWALEFYAENKKENTTGKEIAFAIVQRIKDEEYKIEVRKNCNHDWVKVTVHEFEEDKLNYRCSKCHDFKTEEK